MYALPPIIETAWPYSLSAAAPLVSNTPLPAYLAVKIGVVSETGVSERSAIEPVIELFDVPLNLIGVKPCSSLM